MSRIFINPNWHPALVHFPFCLLIAGVAIEFVTLVYRRPSLRVTGRWMILLGALSAVAVAFSGIYALDDVAFRSQKSGASQASERPWRDLAIDARLHGGPAAPSADAEEQRLTHEAWRLLSWHAWLEAAGTIVVLTTTLAAIGLSARRRGVATVLRLLLLAGLGLIVCGAWFSGESVYRNATASRLKGSNETKPGATTQPLPEKIGAQLEYFLGPPLQAHVFAVGLTVAMAAAALAAAMRKLARTTASPSDAAPTPVPPEGATGAVAARPAPAARLWLAAALLALGTGFLGLWNLSRPDEANTWSPPKLWAAITDKSDNPDGPINRRTAHVIVAVCILLMLLSLAALARWRWQRRGFLTALSLLLFLLLLAQLWLGILLLFDGKGVKHGQPSYRFRPAATSAGSTSAVLVHFRFEIM